MNYIIETIDNEISRLVIQWTPTKFTIGRPSIKRNCIDSCGNWMTMSGSIIGFHRKKSSALVINVRRGDLISISSRVFGRSIREWTHFRITPELKLRVTLVGHCGYTPAVLSSSIFPECAAAIAQSGNCEEAMRKIFTGRGRPKWFQKIIDRQINAWRREQPEKYLYFAPTQATPMEIAESVTVNPFAALRFFRKKLSDDQVDHAITLSIEGGVIFAFERFTIAQIGIALQQCPGTLLTYHWDSLNDEQFEHCARFDPFVGFRIRDQVPDPKHAVLLARSYSVGAPLSNGRNLLDFHQEITKSLRDYPDAWLRAHKNDFSYLLESVASETQLRIDQDFLLTLLVGMPPEFQPIVYRYMAEQI